MTRIGLVGCSATKLDRPAPARELYVSPLFVKASAYAEATCQRWYVLSAKHGLVKPDQVLEPYDVALAANGLDWYSHIGHQLQLELRGVQDPHLVVLAGTFYRKFLYPYCQWPFTIPMKGMGIGQQLAWLSNELRAVAAAS